MSSRQSRKLVITTFCFVYLTWYSSSNVCHCIQPELWKETNSLSSRLLHQDTLLQLEELSIGDWLQEPCRTPRIQESQVVDSIPYGNAHITLLIFNVHPTCHWEKENWLLQINFFLDCWTNSVIPVIHLRVIFDLMPTTLQKDLLSLPYFPAMLTLGDHQCLVSFSPTKLSEFTNGQICHTDL